MLKAITEIFDSLCGQTADRNGEVRVDLAAAILMVDVGLADHDYSGDEERVIERILVDEFALDHAQAAELIASARAEVDDAVGVQEFTRRLNEEFSQEQKVQLVRQLWQVAMADGRLDKYEEHRIRKIADLLYVPHVKFVRARHDATRNAD